MDVPPAPETLTVAVPPPPESLDGRAAGPPALPARPVGLPPIPDSLAWIAHRIDVRIDTLLRHERERWARLDPDLGEPLDAIEQLVMAGGKRLRPAFCHWAYVAAGGTPDDAMVVDAGAALELLHTFALVHDDIMDGSTRRRGMITVHRRYEARHAAESWRGEARRFGEGVAILVGDLAFVYADLLLAGAPRAAHDVFTELRLEVNVGQYLDLLGTAQGEVGMEKARRICQYKSGSYTIERPLHLGAALRGRLDELGPALTAYGRPLGEAFQLRDDLLGAFGDTALTGKPVGDDLREGKPTALYAFAMAAADGAATSLLAERFGSADITPAEVAELQAVLESTGARRQVECTIERRVDEALRSLRTSGLDAEAAARLAELAHFVAGRDH
ncbi:MAG: polyprenyl synthetase family protein [Actinomycetota bacterium]